MNNKAFTLIELLVTIMIIGILASFAYVNLKPKDKIDSSKDATYRSNVDAIRRISMEIFSENDLHNYQGMNSDGRVQDILNLLSNPDLKISSDYNKWVIKTLLKNNKWYCRDYDGNFSEKATQDISDFRCD